MKKPLMIAGLSLIAAGGSIVLYYLLNSSSSPDNPAEASRPPIKSYMKQGFRNHTSLLARVGQLVEEKDIPWDKVQDNAKQFLVLAEKLETCAPPHGDATSWKNLTSSLTQTSKNLVLAAERQDRNASQKEYNKLATSCAGCHDAHR